MLESLALLFLVSCSSAQTVISPFPLVGIEGSNLTVNCSVLSGERRDFELRVDRIVVTTLNKFVGASITDTGTQYVYGPLERSERGAVFECDDALGNTVSAMLMVNWPPTVSPDGYTASLIEGQDSNFTYSLDDGNPSSSPTIVGPGEPPFTRVLFTDTELLINDVNRMDNGTYTATWTNGVGEAAVFTLDLVVNAERGPGLLVLSECSSTSTSVQTAISDIPGIEFPNPMVNCSNVNGVTVMDGRITVTCNSLGIQAGESTNISCRTTAGVDIMFQASIASVAEAEAVGGCQIGCIVGIVVAIAVVIGLVIACGVGTGLLVRHLKRRDKKEENKEDKPVSLM